MYPTSKKKNKEQQRNCNTALTRQKKSATEKENNRCDSRVKRSWFFYCVIPSSLPPSSPSPPSLPTLLKVLYSEGDSLSSPPPNPSRLCLFIAQVLCGTFLPLSLPHPHSPTTVPITHHSYFTHQASSPSPQDAPGLISSQRMARGGRRGDLQTSRGRTSQVFPAVPF